jgi:hypothetical protein
MSQSEFASPAGAHSQPHSPVRNPRHTSTTITPTITITVGKSPAQVLVKRSLSEGWSLVNPTTVQETAGAAVDGRCRSAM